MPEKTWGTFEDFMEGLKLYDKDQNGKLSLAELSQVLVMMAEKMPVEQVEEVIKSTETVEDDEGMIKYDVFVKKIMAGPFPQKSKKKNIHTKNKPEHKKQKLLKKKKKLPLILDRNKALMTKR